MTELMTSMIAMLSLLSVAVTAPAAGDPAYRRPERPPVTAQEIEAKIASAEELGAASCSADELARAKEELLRARREAAVPGSDPARSQAALERAWRAADELLRNRQFAARHGLICQPQ